MSPRKLRSQIKWSVRGLNSSHCNRLMHRENASQGPKRGKFPKSCNVLICGGMVVRESVLEITVPGAALPYLR
jgi:hypothetical protein